MSSKDYAELRQDDREAQSQDTFESNVANGAAWVGTPTADPRADRSLPRGVGDFEIASLQVNFNTIPYADAKRSMRALRERSDASVRQTTLGRSANGTDSPKSNPYQIPSWPLTSSEAIVLGSQGGEKVRSTLQRSTPVDALDLRLHRLGEHRPDRAHRRGQRHHDGHVLALVLDQARRRPGPAPGSPCGARGPERRLERFADDLLRNHIVSLNRAQPASRRFRRRSELRRPGSAASSRSSARRVVDRALADDAAVGEDVAAVGEAHRDLRVLLDQQDRVALALDAAARPLRRCGRSAARALPSARRAG